MRMRIILNSYGRNERMMKCEGRAADGEQEASDAEQRTGWAGRSRGGKRGGPALEHQI